MRKLAKNLSESTFLELWKIIKGKSYDQLKQHIRKQRHYFANKGPSSQGYGFPSSLVWIWELNYKESWVPKNWCFCTVVWRRLLDCKEFQQSILNEISPEYSLEGLMLKLKLQYFVHLMRRTDSFENTLMLGRIESKRRGGRQRVRWLSLTQWTWVWASSRSWWWTGRPGVLHAVHGVTKSQTRLSDWIDWLTEYIFETKHDIAMGLVWDWNKWNDGSHPGFISH